MKKKKPSEIKTVIFDMGNVLLNFDARRAAVRFSKECKVPLIRIWRHFFTDPTEKAYTRGEISTYQFYKYAKKSLCFPVNYKTFRHYWNDIFWENYGMEDVLKRLKKNYPLYLISNTNKMHFDHIKKNFRILKYFKKSFPSHEVGHRKPCPNIYKKVLRQIRYRPEETVFVDDVKKFVKGAEEVGMRAIRFRNKRQLIRDLRKIGVKV